MDKNIIEKRKQIAEQRALLNTVAIQLKKEFLGLDTIIDRVLENVSSWLHFPEIQDRPIIINLWGLTGTGKTSLVKRLIQLLGFDHLYYNFDMAESNDKYFDFQDKLDDIYDNCNGMPFVIGLDEFQHARTINENGEEIDKSSIRDVWKLLDSGKLEIIRFDYYLKYLMKIIKKLELAVSGGVEVQDGIVTNNEDVFRKIFENDHNLQNGEDGDDDDDDDEKKPNNKTIRKEKEGLPFISKKVLEDYVINLLPSTSDLILLSDLQNKMLSMNEEATIDFLIDLMKNATKPKLVDCSKSLVFIMGNLDEVYNMNKDFNPDISANEFYEESLLITMPQVKNALLTRFRSEQIARLGNTHIIYPALNENAFYGVLRLELDKIRERIHNLYHIDLVFDTSLEEFVYTEGVIPTQGTRPLFTTIQQIVRSRLGLLINEFYTNAYTATKVVVSISKIEDKENASMNMDFFKEKDKIHTFNQKIGMDLGKLRQEKRDDVQAIVAVHESGHIVLSCVLTNTVPQSAFSVTADSNSSGFTFSKKSWKYMSRKDIINQLAVYMGGYLAEKLIFGEENVTLGASSDLSMATQLAVESFYNCGMGGYLAFFGNPNISTTQSVIYDESSLDNKESLNSRVLHFLQEASVLAEQTLQKQMKFLLVLSDYLSDNRFVNEEQIKNMLSEYGTDYDLAKLVNKDNSDSLFYRNHLKAKIK